MKKYVVILFFLIVANNLIGQTLFPEIGTIGLSATFQSEQYGVEMPVVLDSNWVFTPALSLVYVEESATDIGVGLGFRYFMGQKKVRPFMGLHTGMFMNIPQGTTYNSYGEEIDKVDLFDLMVGFTVGGEYFIDSNFSIGIEAQGNMTSSDEGSYRFGNPDGINFNLATALFATIYF